MQSEGFISRIFGELYSGADTDDSGPVIVHPDVILGKHIKQMEINIKLVADNDPIAEKEIRTWSWYDFHMHMLSIKEKGDSMKNGNED